MKKRAFLGTIAVLAVIGLTLTACPTEPEPEKVYLTLRITNNYASAITGLRIQLPYSENFSSYYPVSTQINPGETETIEHWVEDKYKGADFDIEFQVSGKPSLFAVINDVRQGGTTTLTFNTDGTITKGGSQNPGDNDNDDDDDEPNYLAGHSWIGSDRWIDPERKGQLWGEGGAVYRIHFTDTTNYWVEYAMEDYEHEVERGTYSLSTYGTDKVTFTPTWVINNDLRSYTCEILFEIIQMRKSIDDEVCRFVKNE